MMSRSKSNPPPQQSPSSAKFFFRSSWEKDEKMSKPRRQLHVDLMILNSAGHKQASTSASRNEIAVVEVSSENERKGVESLEPMATLEDMKLLECPICFEPLWPPVYQCDEGHLACDSCCKKINKICHTCAKPTGSIRNRAIENIIQAAKIPCINKQFGCTQKLCYSNKDDHEQNQCIYAPIPCPGCEYVDESKFLYAHFAVQHASSAKPFTFNKYVNLVIDKDETRMILQEKGEKILFVLNRSTVPRGSLVNVTCVAPTASGDEFSYSIVAKTEYSKVSLTDLVEHTPKLIAPPVEKNCLLITKNFHQNTASKSGVLKASVKIMKVKRQESG